MAENFTYDILKKRIQQLEQTASDYHQAKENFEHQKQTQKILIKIAADCINTPLDRTREAIQSSLSIIGEFVGADRAYIFDYDFDKNIGMNTYEWCRQEVTPQIHNLQETPLHGIPEWVETHRKGESVIIPDVSALPHGNLRHLLASQEIKSLAAVPIFDDERLAGFAGFDSVKPFHPYSDREIELLNLFVTLLASLRKRHHAQAVQSRLTAILENTSDLVYTATPDGRLTYLNQAGRHMAGWDKTEPLKNQLIDDLHPDWVLEHITSEGLPRAGQQGLWKGETAIRHRDGRQIPVSQVILGHFSAGGSLAYFSTIMRDISDRVQMEAALRKSEEKFRSLYTSMREGMALHQLVYDASGKAVNYVLLDVNPAYEAITGLQAGQIRGQKATDIYKTDNAPYLDIFANVAATGKPTRFDTHYAPMEKHFRITAFCPAKNHFATVFEDITQRKQAQAEQKELQEQMLQAQKMESVGRLAGGVAHDFNNMLNVILGYSELALKNLDPADRLHARLKKIHHAATRSAGITRQLLAFARKQTVSPRVLDTNQTVEGMLQMLRRVIGENIDLVWKPGKKIQPLKMDPSQIDQILANLCINARDAIADVGKITIETDMVYFDKTYCQNHAGFLPGHYVLLAVSDNGCGMDRHTRENLFEPFFTTKQKGQGTGLGLSTVYGIIKQNNGFIHVYSEPGQGTIFRIYIPPHSGPSTDNRPSKTPETPIGNQETILIVEDEQPNLELLQSMLEQLNYNVLTAAGPSQALLTCRTHAGTIALLITDVVMPEMNGKDLAAQIIRLDPDIRVLFTSGYTANVIAHQGVLDQGVPFLQKPFSLQELACKVQEMLAMSKPVLPV